MSTRRSSNIHDVLGAPAQSVQQTDNHNSPQGGQNHDRSHAPEIPDLADLPVPYTPATTAILGSMLPPPPPPIPSFDGGSDNDDDDDDDNDDNDDDERQHHSSEGADLSESDDHSDSNRDDSEDDDGDRDGHGRWCPINEDKSVPCEDELAYIESKVEHSAVDHKYWEEKTFFDLEDPEIIPVESGRIDWLVNGLNGTKEAPNKETIMRSQVVRIGGYDWRIKLYPRGNHSDYLSVYIDNVTMQDPNFAESEPFESLPFPVLAGMEGLKRPRSVAVQLSVVMYNPAEPRTYEYQVDAHRFTKRSADYGWTRFTRYPRSDFFLRNHGQRQAILRDDKLAFSAYIRVFYDPTGCLWAHGSSPYSDSISMTGLRPWSPQRPHMTAFITLLHFAPFRDLIYRCSNSTSIVAWLQMFLWKMLSRTRSQNYGKSFEDTHLQDPISWLQRAVRALQHEMDSVVVTDLLGAFSINDAVALNRLKTKGKTSIQAALDSHPDLLATPALLTLELQRQEFDAEARRWNKLTNKVDMPEHISVRGKFYPTRYTLFGFITHVGVLTSRRFNSYVRPNGPGTPWFGYRDGHVTCLTHKQAVEKHCGIDPSEPAVKPKGPSQHGWRSRQRVHTAAAEDQDEVAYVVMYVRDDVVPSAFSKPFEESWNVPQAAKMTNPPNASNLAHADAETFRAQYRSLFGVDLVEEDDADKSGHIDSTADRHSTPDIWLRDDEGDVVMSDAEEDGVSVGDEPTESKPPQLLYNDALGLDYYHGELRKNRFHGQGHWIKMNGDEYHGQFRDGLPHGRGTMVYAISGDKYEGEWEAGAHHGQGTLTERSSGNVFEGGWRHGRKHGNFVLRGAVTDEDKGACSICYDREINTAFYDCGHVVACKPCASMLDTCPICRKRILGRVELFGVKVRVE